MIVERVSNREPKSRLLRSGFTRNRTLTVFPWFFAVFGLLFIGAGVTFYIGMRTFMAEAVTGSGTIVSVETRTKRNSDSGRRYTVYVPTVAFSPAGSTETVTFKGHSSRNPDRYRNGGVVDILYLPDDPSHARIDDGEDIRIIPVIFCIVGGIFHLVGLIWLIRRRRAKRRVESLLSRGRRIEAYFVEVERNNSVRVNNRRPFIIVAQWYDPATRTTHTFHSENLWKDPSSLISGDMVTVFIDPDNPGNHHIDLTFLEKHRI